MGAVKNDLVKIQYSFLEYTMRKDGAPDDEIMLTSWDDFICAFYDGNEAAALKDAEDHGQ